MDPFTGAVTITQAVAYCSTLISSLAELYNITKNGRQIFKEHYSNIEQLHLVIKQLLEKDNLTVTPSLHRLLKSVEQTIQQLLHLFNQPKRLKIVTILLTRQKTIDEAFAFLERQKSTLLVCLATENFNSTAPMGGFRNQHKKLSPSHRSRLQNAPSTPPTPPLTPLSNDEVMSIPKNSTSQASANAGLPYNTLSSISPLSTKRSSTNSSMMDGLLINESLTGRSMPSRSATNGSIDILQPPKTDNPNPNVNHLQVNKKSSNRQRGGHLVTKSNLPFAEYNTGNKVALDSEQVLCRHPDLERVTTTFRNNIVGERSIQKIGIAQEGAFELIMKHRYGRD